MMERVAASPNLKARIAGIFYLLTFLTGGFALLVRSRVGVAAGLAAGVCYIAVTLIFYDLFKPVDKRLSFLAAAVSAVGIAVGPLGLTRANPLVFFGFYCLLIGYLIFRSTFLPKALGVLMALASLGWLTFLSPPLAKSLYPYNLAPGLIGEGALTLWLLVVGLDVPSWQMQARPCSIGRRGRAGSGFRHPRKPAPKPPRRSPPGGTRRQNLRR